MILKRKFYERDTRTVAKELLGKVMVRKTENGMLKAKIVETEAYLGSNDPGSIGCRKVVNIPKSLLLPPGHAFVYFTYGNHWMFNVNANKGQLGAVLFRALEPIDGIELMKNNRKGHPMENLTNGPGKLTQALGINKSQDGYDMTKGDLFVTDSREKQKIVTTTRIGLSAGSELPLRFYIKGNKFVSKL